MRAEAVTGASDPRSVALVLGRIAGYELLEQVGEGGMGRVFRARDPSLNKIVAIKILLDSLGRDEEFRARFKREAQFEASLSHPSIADCFRIGEAATDPPDLIPSDTPGLPPAPKLFLVMEFVHGSDLSSLVNGEPIALARVLDLTGQIAAGLEAAHAANVVHRDLKPANVRVTPDGRVKIVDFGLAATIPQPDSKTESFKTTREKIMGTWHFMPPEQMHGRTTDPRSDLFPLGVILYLLVTGRLPFTGEDIVELQDAVLHKEPPPLARYASAVPDELERILRKLLAKSVEDRYQSAHEVRTDIERLRHAPVPGPVPRPKIAWKPVFLALGTVLVLIAAWLLWPRPHTIAVVPLVNRTGDPRLDYLGDGLASGMTATLIRGSRLSVAAMSTVQGIEPQKRTAANLAHELGVSAVLEGSIRKQDDVLRLDLELVEGRHGFVIWADSYDYDLSAGDDVERQIVRDVMNRLLGPFAARRTQAPKPTKPAIGSAYDLVLRASSALDDPDDAKGPDRALQYLDKAVDEDPDFALAWAWRSRALSKIWVRDETEASLRLAEEAANRALRLNPELLEARVARAQVYKNTSRYADAIRELKSVLSVNPNWDEAELQLAAAYRDAGDLAQAEFHFRHATEVRPGYWRNWNSLGWLLVLRGDFAGARAAYGQVIHLVPEKNVGYTQLAIVEIKDGRYDAAIAMYEKLPSPVQDAPTAANIGTAYFFKRRLKEAGRYYALAAQLEPRTIGVWLNLGDLDTRAGQPDSARAHYLNALQLVGERLRIDPRNIRVHVQRTLCLAKLGRCDEAFAALAAAADTLPSDDAELAHQLAKAYALCGRRDQALAEARRAVELGASAALLRDEDEFAKLVGDPAFPAAPLKTP